MKKCNKCFEVKSFDQFFKDKRHSSGHYSICKSCKTKGTLEWREKNRARYNEMARIHHAKNKDKRRDVDLKRKYGSSLAEYNQIFKEQGYVCWICQKPHRHKNLFAMDHNHATGKVRGVLCFGCNRALHVLETRDLLDRAQKYLDHFKD